MSFIEWKEKIKDIPEKLAPFLIQIFTVLKVLCMSFSPRFDFWCIYSYKVQLIGIGMSSILLSIFNCDFRLEYSIYI